jgi:hypothetical protein
VVPSSRAFGANQQIAHSTSKNQRKDSSHLSSTRIRSLSRKSVAAQPQVQPTGYPAAPVKALAIRARLAREGVFDSPAAADAPAIGPTLRIATENSDYE